MTWASDDGRAFEDAVRALAYLGIFVLVVVASRRGEARGLAARPGRSGSRSSAAIALLARFEPSLFGDPDADLARDLPAIARPAHLPDRLLERARRGDGRGDRPAAPGSRPPARPARARSLAVGGHAAAAARPLDDRLARRDRRGADRDRDPGRRGARPARGWSPTSALGAVAGAALVVLAEEREELLNHPVDPAAARQGDEMLAFTIVAAIVAGAARFALDAPVAAPRGQPWSSAASRSRSP